MGCTIILFLILVNKIRNKLEKLWYPCLLIEVVIILYYQYKMQHKIVQSQVAMYDIRF